MLTKQMFFLVILLFGLSATSQAGSVTNGQWVPTGCGTKPEAPKLESSVGGVEAYNATVQAFNEWQKAAQTYISCLVTEANTDSVIILKSSNDEQNNLRAGIDKLKAEVETLRGETMGNGALGGEQIPESPDFEQEQTN